MPNQTTAAAAGLLLTLLVGGCSDPQPAQAVNSEATKPSNVPAAAAQDNSVTLINGWDYVGHGHSGSAATALALVALLVAPEALAAEALEGGVAEGSLAGAAADGATADLAVDASAEGSESSVATRSYGVRSTGTDSFRVQSGTAGSVVSPVRIVGREADGTYIVRVQGGDRAGLYKVQPTEDGLIQVTRPNGETYQVVASQAPSARRVFDPATQLWVYR